LPSVYNTRQSPENTTPGKGHSAVNIPAKTSLPSARPFVGHSAKALPSVRLDTRQRKVAVTAFGTVMALCRAPSVWRSAKGLIFAERPQSGARQRLVLCRVTVTWHSAKGRLCRAPNRGRSAKFTSLCRVPVTWHSAKFRSLCRVLFLYTRQRVFFKILIYFFRGILHKHIFTQAYYIYSHRHII
jgi:hypothetical protein